MKIQLIAGFLAMALLLQAVPLNACTGIKLTAKDHSAVHGRTLEFGNPVQLQIAVIPRNYSFVASTPLGKGLAYTSKYAVVGCLAFDNPAALDGMNEKGLSIGTFYFPTFAEYTPTTKENQSYSLSPVDFPNWVLTQFATTQEVKDALPKIVIAPTVVEQWGNSPAPFHYIVYDKNGDAIVIEPVQGKLQVYDNPLGTLTNSPTFDWHMTNLRNFIHLSPYNAETVEMNGVKLAPLGQGTGLLGMPGDFSPPSRFVRAALFSSAATPVATSEEAVWQGFHILNNFDIPLGAAREKTGDTYASDYTQLTCMRNPNTMKYYFKSYEDQTIHVVDFSSFDFNAKEIKQWKIHGRQETKNVTSKLEIKSDL